MKIAIIEKCRDCPVFLLVTAFSDNACDFVEWVGTDYDGDWMPGPDCPLVGAPDNKDEVDLIGEFDNLVCSCHNGFKPGDAEFVECPAGGCESGILPVRAVLEAVVEAIRRKQEKP